MQGIRLHVYYVNVFLNIMFLRIIQVVVCDYDLLIFIAVYHSIPFHCCEIFKYIFLLLLTTLLLTFLSCLGYVPRSGITISAWNMHILPLLNNAKVFPSIVMPIHTHISFV